MTDLAQQPEDLTRLFVQRANNHDAHGLAELCEPNAVLAFRPGQMTVGREAIRRLYEQMLAKVPRFEPEEPLPTLRNGDHLNCKSPIPIRQAQSAFHQDAQRNASRRRDVRLQSRSFARKNPRL